jgi:hypothetical protein
MFDYALHPWDQAKKERTKMSDFKKIGNGGMWIKEGRNGKFLSGKLAFDMMGRRIEVNFLGFKNNEKEGKQPDYKIVVSEYTDATRPKEAPYQNQTEKDDVPF